MKKRYIAAIAAGVIVVGLGAYVFAYKDKYYPGTTIDNINVSGLTVAKAEAYIAEVPSFPVPPQYAHPAVLDRMIRVIREGKAETVDKAFMLMKEELKGLDHTKTVSQEEYDEIVLVKPMFRVMNYQ